MHRLLGIALLVSACAVGAACDDSPTEPGKDTVHFTAQLLPANEVPPVANAEASGTGTAAIDLAIERSGSGTITAARADFQVALTGFPAGTPITMAHIHSGVTGASGGIVVDTGLEAGEVALDGGTGSITKRSVVVEPSVAQQILDNPGSFYFNVHTVLNPTGVARGQLVRQ